ncbi:TetR/AcrR family transcriptional regulator [Alicyclobacillus acidoterrestris]|uniref:TetR/AcrR family transcriptional regulator n=1 Tax=Alicyclobacillus acidoterrestris (strain ATCC 49025 / DSM 3922 / CIP 106132 / NCIMB 13137 / GD3B) TaxID=1356854 RepID=T0BE19_ALIAG|nr:TetR/AcrR family transcriptional regulator [Alicyclobacillus acidoterrestris]EPZ42263.1 hypothetical protein N007_15705 [Alicyclobacillus acidoterrestris ATCC 49025]UNO47874.1 TetR/AcrR family transcriptional regulator [Alicyclobacillus acidoterrestris]GEO27929.1 TetR family transcriptional regulator [Alicyclobacillus acidoterrestris]
MNGFDRRVARTRRLLIDALIKLIVEDGYDAVTIRGIVKKADVNRSTFYLHFRDKQDILNYMENEVLSELAAAIRNPNYTYESALWDYKILKRPIQSAIALFEHVEKYASLYRTILVEKDFRARVTQVTSTELFSFLPNELEVAFVSNGIIGLILYWLENGMKETVTEMSLWLTRFSLSRFSDVSDRLYVTFGSSFRS